MLSEHGDNSSLSNNGDPDYISPARYFSNTTPTQQSGTVRLSPSLRLYQSHNPRPLRHDPPQDLTSEADVSLQQTAPRIELNPPNPSPLFRTGYLARVEEAQADESESLRCSSAASPKPDVRVSMMRHVVQESESTPAKGFFECLAARHQPKSDSKASARFSKIAEAIERAKAAGERTRPKNVFSLSPPARKAEPAEEMYKRQIKELRREIRIRDRKLAEAYTFIRGLMGTIREISADKSHDSGK